MENAPIVHIGYLRVQPEYAERFGKWLMEAYWPLWMKSPLVRAVNRYQILKDTPEYPPTFTMMYFENFRAISNFWASPESVAVAEDFRVLWTKRGEMGWGASYQLVRSFRDCSPSVESPSVEDAPVIHLEGISLSSEEEDTYDTWFEKWGCEVYMPLLMKMPGIIDCRCYRLLHYDLPESFRVRDPAAHPTRLSVLHFENAEAYEDYKKSLEKSAFEGALSATLRRGLNYKWYVQYQLMKSWRK